MFYVSDLLQFTSQNRIKNFDKKLDRAKEYKDSSDYEYFEVGEVES